MKRNEDNEKETVSHIELIACVTALRGKRNGVGFD